MKHKVLIGFMGCGKSSVGKELSERLQIPFLDTDAQIEAEQGCSISEIFSSQGETAFRQMESELLKRLAERKTPMVIATGGGLAAQMQNHPLLKRLGDVIYLQISPRTVCERLAGDVTRPLLQGEDKERRVEELLSARRPLYEAAATVCVCADVGTPQEITDKILERLVNQQ